MSDIINHLIYYFDSADRDNKSYSIAHEAVYLFKNELMMKLQNIIIQ